MIRIINKFIYNAFLFTIIALQEIGKVLDIIVNLPGDGQRRNPTLQQELNWHPATTFEQGRVPGRLNAIWPKPF